MTAAFSQIDQKMIEAKLWVAMDCHPVAGLSLSAKARKQDRKREQKRKQVSLASDKFFDAMNADNPPQSREEAISRIVGFAGKLLSFIFPQYALIISVVIWLWDFTHA